jgi:hypothetical protein
LPPVLVLIANDTNAYPACLESGMQEALTPEQRPFAWRGGT